MKNNRRLALVLTVCLLSQAAILAQDEKVLEKKSASRNPFGVVDVLEPNWKDVGLFAATVKLAGGANDANAESWGMKVAQEQQALDGDWSSRWNVDPEGGFAQGTAKVQTVGERVYILYQEGEAAYLIDAGKEGKNRLVGKYLNLLDHRDTYPWVGLIVNNERIDGAWTGGRWDFRRQLTDD